MANVTKCRGEDCQLRDRCWRYKAPASEPYDWYSTFDDQKRLLGADTCEYFVPVLSDKLKETK